jgi:hypothetical protein
MMVLQRQAQMALLELFNLGHDSVSVIVDGLCWANINVKAEKWQHLRNGNL